MDNKYTLVFSCRVSPFPLNFDVLLPICYHLAVSMFYIWLVIICFVDAFLCLLIICIPDIGIIKAFPEGPG